MICKCLERKETPAGKEKERKADARMRHVGNQGRGGALSVNRTVGPVSVAMALAGRGVTGGKTEGSFSKMVEAVPSPALGRGPKRPSTSQTQALWRAGGALAEALLFGLREQDD